MPEETLNCARIFISYVHKDQREHWLDRVLEHLGALCHQGLIAPFEDRMIAIGGEWDETIRRKLDESDLIIFLVSPSFLNSPYCNRVEVKRALERHRAGEAKVMPIIVRPCVWEDSAFATVQAFPRPGPDGLVPLSSWRPDADEPLAKIARDIRLWAKGFIEKKTAAQAQPSPPPDAIDLARYAERARLKYEAVDLSALAAPGADDPDARPKLYQVFIPQAARRSRPAVSLPRDYLESQGLDPDAEARLRDELMRRWQAAERAPALDLLARDDTRRAVVLGDAGAGKSALARFVLLRLLEPPPPMDGDDRRHAWRAKLDGYVPFLIELRDYITLENKGKCPNFLRYLDYLGAEQGFAFDLARLEWHLATKPALVVFDGLDEIFDPTTRRRIAEEIIGFAVRFPTMRVLVTSRIAGFDAHPFEAAEFAVVTLDDLDNDQIDTFAERWFALVFPGQPEQAVRSTRDLLDTLGQRPQLKELAGNPLLLTIMAIVARHRPLARSRAALYAQALGVLCHHWDYKRGLELPADSPLRDLTPEDTLDLLRRIAWRMQEADEGLRANAIAEANLRATIEGYFADPWHFDLGRRRRAAAEMLDQLQKRHWILTLRGPALYGFVHRTFLEYLCAAELIERFKSREIEPDELRDRYVLTRADDDSWREVIRLLVAGLPIPHATSLIAALLPELAVLHERQSRIALVFQCLAEQEKQKFRQFAYVAGRALVTLDTWLQLRDPILGPAAKTAEQIVDALITLESADWPAPDLSHDDLQSGVKDHHWYIATLLSALAKGAWPDEDERKALLVDHVLNRRAEPSSRVAAIRALCTSFRDDAATRTLVVQQTTEDPDAGVRRAALGALAGHFRDAAEVRPLLLRRAAEDPDAGVRRAAVFAWAWTYQGKLERGLVSRDLDGLDPGIDPRQPITLTRVKKAAKLGKSTDEIKAAYEKITEDLPLKLEWRTSSDG